MPDLRELQRRTLARVKELLADGSSAEAVQQAIAECKPFFEQFRVAQGLLVSPNSLGLTVIVKPGLAVPS
jgi:hypothetical protein